MILNNNYMIIMIIIMMVMIIIIIIMIINMIIDSSDLFSATVSIFPILPVVFFHASSDLPVD